MLLHQTLIKGFLDGVRPEPKLTVSEWSDRFRMLDSKSAAEPGLYRTSRTPYLKEIMDNLSPYSPVQRVVFMKAAQIGATEVGNNWVGYCIDNAPGPFLLVQPTDEMVKRNSKMRIAPLIDSTPKLRDKVREARSRDSGNTILQKEFPGGVLIMTGANSPIGLRSMPARYVFLDEIDAYPPDVGGEGSPIDLAEKRTSTFPNKKMFLVSTPTIQGSSQIETEFLRTDQRYFFVPCPHCGTVQHLEFAQLKWETGKYNNVCYQCKHCNELIPERLKTSMLNAGEWMATCPQNINEKIVGYHLNALYSPWGWRHWYEIAKEYDDAEGLENKMKTFVNTTLGETFKQQSSAPEYERIYERCQDYPDNVPFNEVAFITIGVDVQADRIECDIVGWMKGKISQQIDYRVLIGDTTKQEVWNQLDLLLTEPFVKQNGYVVPVKLMAVDAGYNTNLVYTFCQKHGVTKTVPIKGSEKLEMTFSAPRALQITKQGQKVGTLKVWMVGVSYIKHEIYSWLRQNINPETGEVPTGYCYFRKRELSYFRGLTAEVIVTMKDARGYLKHVWQKKYERNEPLDTRVYARAAAAIAGMDRMQDADWQTLIDAQQLYQKNTIINQPKPAKKVPKETFWDAKKPKF